MEHDDWPAHFSPKVGRTSIQQSHQVGQNHNVTQAQQKLYMIDTRTESKMLVSAELVQSVLETDSSAMAKEASTYSIKTVETWKKEN